MTIFLLWNGATQLGNSALPVSITANTATTLLQVAPTRTMVVKEWGVSFNLSAAATPGVIELVETDQGANVTAYVNADVTIIDNPTMLPSSAIDQYAILGGLANSGYNATSEGITKPTLLRNLDSPKLIPPTTLYDKQFPLDEGAIIQVGKFLRLRANVSIATSGFAYVKLQG